MLATRCESLLQSQALIKRATSTTCLIAIESLYTVKETNMQYTITSDTLMVPSKKKGDTVAEKELLEAGLNVAALVSGGHLSSNALTKPQAEGASN